MIVPFSSSARADTAPPSGVPATVSADALPTVQTDGVVWATAISGNTVYATGKFTTATDIDGQTYTRNNLLAFDITTGSLKQTFNHALSGGTGNCWSTAQQGAQGCSVAVSPDGTKLIVGGSFTAVDGQARANSAAFDLTNNTLLPGFSGAGNTVMAVEMTNTQAFIGGAFSAVNGVSKLRLAAFTNSTGALDTAWTANVTGVNSDGSSGAVAYVYGIAAAENVGNLIVVGSFNRINGVKYNSQGAVKLAGGTNVTPWASQSDSSFPIRMQGTLGPVDTLGYTSATVAGNQAYITAFTYQIRYPGSFEGRAAINTSNGNLVFMQQCLGDTYDSIAIAQVLYSVSHAHNCIPIGDLPEWSTRQYAMADTTYATGTITAAVSVEPNYIGQPAASVLNWYPNLTAGTYSGQAQAAWTVTGNSQYIVLGGEFPQVNGVNQRGLTRMGVAAVAPNKRGPLPYESGVGLGVEASPASSAGLSTVRVHPVGDDDNELLTYRVYRVGSTTPVATNVFNSRAWRADSWTFNDTGVPQGTSYDYYLTITDPFGNQRTYNNVTAHNDSDSRLVYSGSGWTNVTNRTKYPDFSWGIHHTKTSGAKYTLTFYGSAITLYGEKNSDRGTSTVKIDGASMGTINQSGSGSAFQEELFTKSGLGFGKHSIVVTKSSDGKYMDIDAARVTQDRVIDSANTAAISYTGGAWTTRQNGSTNNYGGGIVYTAVNGAKATASFYGSSVAIMTERGTGRGTYTMSVDGGAPINCTAYNSAVQYQQITCQASGLAVGNHTVVVTKTGGSYMDVDAIFYR